LTLSFSSASHVIEDPVITKLDPKGTMSEEMKMVLRQERGDWQSAGKKEISIHETLELLGSGAVPGRAEL
jgi:hypothetical protein